MEKAGEMVSAAETAQSKEEEERKEDKPERGVLRLPVHPLRSLPWHTVHKPPAPEQTPFCSLSHPTSLCCQSRSRRLPPVRSLGCSAYSASTSTPSRIPSTPGEPS
jgi:hypothetical protein